MADAGSSVDALGVASMTASTHALVERLKRWLERLSQHVEQAYIKVELVEQVVAALAAAQVPPHE